MHEEITSYIERAQKQGLSDEQIRHNLDTVGWESHLVEEAFAALKQKKENLVAVSDVKIAQPPVVKLSEIPSPATKKAHLQKWAMVAGGCLILALGGFAVYKAFASPDRIFNRFLENGLDQVYQNNFSFSYFDAGSDQADSEPNFNLKNIVFSMSGKARIDVRNADSSKTDSEFSYTLGSGSTSFSTGVKVKTIGKDLYINVGDNPLINSFLAASGTKAKIDWIHINLDDAKSSPASEKLYSYFSSDQFKQAIRSIWDLKQMVRPGKYLGAEKINGVMTYHYSVVIDKQRIKDNLAKTLDQLAKADPQNFSSDTVSTTKNVFNALIDKMELKKVEAWVGIRDQRLYKISIETSAPSIASLVKLSSSELQSGGSLFDDAEAKRLADLRQLATALELFYNYNNGYPPNLSDLVPAYIGTVPEAGPAQGACSDQAAKYSYSSGGTAHSGKKGTSVSYGYTLYTCLGQAVGGYEAGIISLSPAGLKSQKDCPPKLANCLLSTSRTDNAVENAVKNIISKLDFTANLKYNADYSDYGKEVNIEAPTGAKDLKDLMSQSPSMMPNPLPAQ